LARLALLNEARRDETTNAEIPGRKFAVTLALNSLPFHCIYPSYEKLSANLMEKLAYLQSEYLTSDHSLAG
jgi:hypothetical protein